MASPPQNPPQPETPAAGSPLEIIPSSPGEDSAVEADDDDLSTQSLSSSILKYPIENGRRYHAYEAGKYPLPNDDVEQDRLDWTHHIFLLTFEGKLVLNPGYKSGSAQRVLDLGTGTGIWAIDYADAHPGAHVIAVDLSPIQPSLRPPNLECQIDDIEKEWTWTRKFGLIFCRSMIGSITDWKSLAQKAFEHLEPGGWFEIHENLYPLFSQREHGKFERTNLCKWSVKMVEGAKAAGRPIDVAPQLAGILREMGFTEVAEHIRPVPIGSWPRDPKPKELGGNVAGMLDSNLEGISIGLFTRYLGFDYDETIAFLAQVRRDIRNPEIQGLSKAYAVWGQKPLDSGN